MYRVAQIVLKSAHRLPAHDNYKGISHAKSAASYSSASEVLRHKYVESASTRFGVDFSAHYRCRDVSVSDSRRVVRSAMHARIGRWIQQVVLRQLT